MQDIAVKFPPFASVLIIALPSLIQNWEVRLRAFLSLGRHRSDAGGSSPRTGWKNLCSALLVIEALIFIVLPMFLANVEGI